VTSPVIGIPKHLILELKIDRQLLRMRSHFKDRWILIPKSRSGRITQETNLANPVIFTDSTSMKMLKIVILVLLIIVSLAAGGAKLLQMPQEVRFFRDAGLDIDLLIPLGAMQIIGALLAIPKKTRLYGLILVSAGFLISAVAIYLTGNVLFAMVSLIPFALTLWMARTAQSKDN